MYLGNPKREDLTLKLRIEMLDEALSYQHHGGTFDRDDWSLAVNPEQSNRIPNTHTEIAKGVK